MRQVYSVAWSPDEGTLARAGFGGTIRRWNNLSDDGNDRSSTICIQAHERNSFVYSLAYSPDGRYLASGGVNHIRLWTIANLSCAKVFTHSAHWVRSNIGFSPDGKMLVSGSFDRGVRLWDLETRDGGTVGSCHVNRPKYQQSPMVYSVAISPDGRTLATGGNDGMVRLCGLGN
jgi:WD40 repeat protein